MKTSLDNTLNAYIEKSNFFIGKEYTNYYINHIHDILYCSKFYLQNCKLPFIIKKKIYCPLTVAANSFPKNTYWATFHSNWRTQFGKFVIFKGTTIVHITWDPNSVRLYLDLPLP
jgi:hypothetical protein